MQAFDFDRVFGPEVQQAGIFEDVSQLVTSALDGYNVCIFAYGQTGKQHWLFCLHMHHMLLCLLFCQVTRQAYCQQTGLQLRFQLRMVELCHTSELSTKQWG